MRQIIFSMLLVLFSLFFTTSVAAQDYGVGCAAVGYPGNHFDCSVNSSQEWSISSNNCEPGYEINLSLCGGSWSDRQICNTVDPETGEVLRNNYNCCLACIPIEEEGSILGWGDRCGENIDGTCQQGLECRNNQCLNLRSSIRFGNVCIDSSECRAGTSGNPFEALVCREIDGRSICTYATEERVCTEDDECREATGNPEATCVGGQCQLPPPDPEVIASTGLDPNTPFNYCAQLPGTEDDFSNFATQRGRCVACMGSWNAVTGKYANEGEKIYTAVGCVNVSGSALAADLIKLLLGISGGVALLSMIAAAFKFSVSRGESGQVKEAKELMTAAISGLLFIIFSVIILQFIGVDILRIPGLG